MTLGNSDWLGLRKGATDLGHRLCASDLKNMLFSMLANIMKKGENRFHYLERTDWLPHIPSSFLNFKTSGASF